jgi:hypothetical protein
MPDPYSPPPILPPYAFWYSAGSSLMVFLVIVVANESRQCKSHARANDLNNDEKCSVEELEAEIRWLRAENAKLLEQREVLKKSLGILSEAPPRGMPESNR